MMVNPRYSCCYIPVGVTVFISSLLSLILSSVAAGMFFWFIHSAWSFISFCSRLSLSHPLAVDAQPDPLVDSGVKVTSGAMIGMIIAGVVFVGIAVISLFGYVFRFPCAFLSRPRVCLWRSPCRFIGSVIRNRRMVKAYSILVWICFLFWLPLAGFTFALSFPPGSLIRCYRDLKEFPCGSAFDVGRKTSFLVSNVLGLLIELCKPTSLPPPAKISSNFPLPYPRYLYRHRAIR